MELHGGPGRDLEPETEQACIGSHADGAAEPLRRLDEAYAEVRDSVAGAIGEALALADQIRSEARAEADELSRRTEADAEARAEAIMREAERNRSEAEEYTRDMRLAVEAYASKQRREAEQEATRTVEEAEARARAIRAAAEEAANEIERVSARRQEQLRAEARLLEERKLRVLDSLRDIAVQLENVDPPSGELPAREGREPY